MFYLTDKYQNYFFKIIIIIFFFSPIIRSTTRPNRQLPTVLSTLSPDVTVDEHNSVSELDSMTSDFGSGGSVATHNNNSNNASTPSANEN